MFKKEEATMYKNLRKQLICLGLMTTLITSGAGVRTVSAVEEPGAVTSIPVREKLSLPFCEK